MKKKIITVIMCAAISVTIVFHGIKPYTVCAAEYEYDELGRVTKVTYDDNSSVTYEYDANGNILSVTITEGEVGKNPQIPQETTPAAENGNKPDNANTSENSNESENSQETMDTDIEDDSAKNHFIAEDETVSGKEISITGAESENTGFFRRLWNGIVNIFSWIWSVIKSFFSWLLSLIRKFWGTAFQK